MTARDTRTASATGRESLVAGATPPYDAVIFDMDGVVTDTAALHAQAWKQLFDTALQDPRAGRNAAREPFDIVRDYRRWVDGRTREDGVVAFLGSRGIEIPYGDDGDPGDGWTAYGLAARKNSIYQDLLARQGVRVFPGTVALLHRLRAGGIRTGLVTASRNAGPLLEAAQLRELFDVVVDGVVAMRMHLAGKPDPAMFLEAAHRLGVRPRRSAIVEDAVAGVEAGIRGGFGLVVGIDRTGQRAALERAGAHLVLGDVAELDLGALRRDPWLLVYEGFDPAHEGHREALTVLANGYLGTRGAATEHRADSAHYPGIYLAGVYNRVTSTLHGRAVEDEHMVNTPDWTVLDLSIDEGPWWSAGGLSVRQERRELDLRTGVLTRTVQLVDADGRVLHLSQRRLVSMARPHVAALQTTLLAQGWSGRVRVRSGIDAGVNNSNVAEYRALNSQHLVGLTAGHTPDSLLLVQTQTSLSRIRIATAVRTTASSGRTRHLHSDEVDRTGIHAQQADVRLLDGQPVVIDKTAAIVTSRDPAIASPSLAALTELRRTPGGFADLLPSHRDAWAQLWDRFAIELDGAGIQRQLVLNLHLFHLAQTLTTHTADLDAGVPARGLHGEGYRGHVFWDELFVLPIITLHLPEVARSLLRYRSRRLPAARAAAAAIGSGGAMFPWQSGSDGREETPAHLFNPRSGRWMPDNSHRQRHIGLAVAHNAWQFYECTGDLDWLAAHGAELIIEVARLFTSMATYDAQAGRYHLAGVVGPDEYHDGYPETPGSGLRDNAYTNIMTAWVCRRAVEILDLLDGHTRDELTARMRIDEASEPDAWLRLSRKLFVPFHDGVISQFHGYDALAELDWERYRAQYGNIGRLDLILEAENDSTNRYKLSKQADVLMLIYLLGPDQLPEILDRLGYPCPPDLLDRTVDYYLQRTAHGSTLSRVVHASVLARMRPAQAWTVFEEALVADLDDTQGGTTAHGIHLGAMAGTIDIVLRCFAGLRCHGGQLTFDPRLPGNLTAIRFGLHYRGHRIDVDLDHTRLRLTSRRSATAADIRVEAGGVRTSLSGGEVREFPLAPTGYATTEPDTRPDPVTSTSDCIGRSNRGLPG
ncbi:beta-phosphoglucomutase family hydrolase [Nocardia amamiensis]|uniref:Beta-phosphoglucomutase family hydrolase n=1 Tax=Nocardia amamiensis TaxID=404578 RepID=A0ABS0CVZ0_9NOCA|nr:beta-phosphoglucomutase family hydrolase [Nocardia amamiensis]MBF6299009.1 beta-phosphoglucomutase family hydrolase [Nocardia amamiensis]